MIFLTTYGVTKSKQVPTTHFYLFIPKFPLNLAPRPLDVIEEGDDGHNSRRAQRPIPCDPLRFYVSFACLQPIVNVFCPFRQCLGPIGRPTTFCHQSSNIGCHRWPIQWTIWWPRWAHFNCTFIFGINRACSHPTIHPHKSTCRRSLQQFLVVLFASLVPSMFHLAAKFPFRFCHSKSSSSLGRTG